MSAQAGNIHSEKTYTFVVDYGQNMEIPVYKEQQPGCTYYFSPLSMYNLGVVNHGHIYNNGKIGEHMYAHVYQEGVGKKGANNVASLIVKTLQLLNLLQDDSVGGELNIIFDNCSGQNKNNTVLKLAPWLMAMGFFKKVNFIFLVVGHTKNAADRLFNSLKCKYHKKNLFMMDSLVAALDLSDSVTVIPTVANDFLEYDSLFKKLFRDLAGQIKKNHIFSCSVDDNEPCLNLCESCMIEHGNSTHKVWRKLHVIDNVEGVRQYSYANLTVIKCIGLNPYKMVEMWKNYHPNIPVEFQNNELYAKPDKKVLAMVKDEKSYRFEVRAKLKAEKAAGMKEIVERIAFDTGDGDIV